ncbi:MAG TPA: phospholipase D-like domain-containing protein [Thermoanaerobaculia bacterium]|nr:phospholipase D-like domain-containing protein [Thermoanaerobaculia bacterium]
MRRRRRWRPILRPRAGRIIPEELRAQNVWRLGAALSEGVLDPGFALLLRRIDQAPIVEGNHVEIFFGGDEAFAAMQAAIESAREQVLVESYIWKDDETGHVFREALGRAAARGVAVRVLADAFGSFATRAGFWRGMRERGIEVRLFHPLFPHPFFQPFRDHRKILVVDRRVAFTGGMNIGDEYGSSRAARTGPWRDTHARVEGPAAWEMAIVFSEAWSHAGGSPLELPALEPSGGSGAAVLVLDSRPGRGHGETASVLSAIAGAARRRIWIVNAYFAPRLRAVRILGEAVRRGADVRLLLPGRSDVSLVRHAGHGHYAALLERGVRVFEYQAAILHAKTLVADDYVSLVGSTNLDFRSFHFNAECNLVILHGPTGRTLSAAFEEDLLHSVEITPALWSRRSFPHRLGDALARRLGPLL